MEDCRVTTNTVYSGTVCSRHRCYSLVAAIRQASALGPYELRSQNAVCGRIYDESGRSYDTLCIGSASTLSDQELWEFASALPFEIRLRRGRLKAILREIASRRVGQRVSSGRKRGFSIPVQRWLAGRWRSKLEDLLHNSQLEREGWVRSAQTLQLLDKASRTGWVPNQLWYIFVLESWLRHEQDEIRSQPPVTSGLLSDRRGENCVLGVTEIQRHYLP